MIQDEAAEADALADQVNRLALLHGDPERFHLIKDDVARRLRRMAKRLRGEKPGASTTTWRPEIPKSRKPDHDRVFTRRRPR